MIDELKAWAEEQGLEPKNNLLELHDDKTDRVVFVGTEAECIKYSKEHPEKKFYFVEKSKKNKK